MSTITVNKDQELYVIPCGEGFTCLGFDNALDELDRITTERVGRGDMTWVMQRDMVAAAKAARGTLSVYDTLEAQRKLLKAVCEQQGEQAVYNLSPQLIGLEGWKVQVRDTEHADTRHFIVGKSTGWAPCHLEIRNRNADGGPAAMRDYYLVSEVERVR